MAVESLRLETAPTMMEDSSHTLDVVALLSGFGDCNRKRRAFLQAFGQSAQAMRR